jgi:hypothetical protein
MFILSWSPYAVICMYSAFIAKNEINFYTAILPGILAKLTIVWCPFIDIIFNSRVKKAIYKSLPKAWLIEQEEVIDIRENFI